MMKNLRMCACLLTAPLLAGLMAGCASASAGGPTPSTGHLAGRLVMEGGPLGPGGQQPAVRPIRGTVTFTAAGRAPVTVKVGSSGTFSVLLPPGRYHVSGRSPAIVQADGGDRTEQPCSQPASATVTAGHTATVTLACIVP